VYPIALVCFGIPAIVSLVVGVRLLALARRTRRFPEYALSAALLLLNAVGYPVMLAAVGLERLGQPGVALVFFFALSAMFAGVSMNYFFTWRVFRSDAPWALALCVVGTWLMLAPSGAIAAHVEMHSIDAGIQSAPVWCFTVIAAVLVTYAWTAVESLHYYLNSRRRLRLGLVEAPVCNRFFLWALASGAWFFCTALAAVVLVRGLNPLGDAFFTVSIGAGGLVNSVAMVLCFMPPQRYLAWLTRRAAAMHGA